MCEILKVETPLEILSLAAGEHQGLQMEVSGAMTADVFAHMTLRCQAKANSHDQTPFLSDEELYVELLSVGLLPKVDTKTSKATKRKKKDADELAVCLTPVRRKISHFHFFHRRRSSSDIGVLYVLWQQAATTCQKL